MLHLAVLLPLGLVAVFISWAVYVTTYWKRHQMPYIPALPFIGNFKDIATFKTAVGECMQELYTDPNGRDHGAVGFHMFYKPALMIRDPELIRRVLVRDFASFCERYSHADHHYDILGGRNLFFLPHRQWRTLRAHLTPFFTAAKLRQMFYMMKDIGQTFDRRLGEMAAVNSMVEVRDRMARYTIDVVATCAFGVQANSLVDENCEFRHYGRLIFDFTYRRAAEFTSIFFLPEWVSVFRCKLFTEESGNFLRNTINYVIGEREKSNVQRNDLIDTLIELKNSDTTGHEDLIFEGDVLVAQASIFFTAGYETSSSTMTFALYELAKNPDVQARLREEIQQTLTECNGELTYDAVNNMEYLNMVFLETLRLYPILPFLDRRCTSTDGYSIEPFANFTIPIGMPVIIPTYALHRDPQYFPNPERFNPERFIAENRANILPYTYMPFGLGPHNCIGERFAGIQSKIGLVSFLRNHRVKPSRLTPCLDALVLGKTSLLLQPEKDLYLNVEPDPLLL